MKTRFEKIDLRINQFDISEFLTTASRWLELYLPHIVLANVLFAITVSASGSILRIGTVKCKCNRKTFLVHIYLQTDCVVHGFFAEFSCEVCHRDSALWASVSH